MALPVLRRYSLATVAVNTGTLVGSLTPANKALVVSKVIVATAPQATVLFHMSIGTTWAASTNIAVNVNLPSGSTYTETGLVIPAGEGLWVYTTTANGIFVNLFGEEVDN